jgi:hypothetical protein
MLENLRLAYDEFSMAFWREFDGNFLSKYLPVFSVISKKFSRTLGPMERRENLIENA